MNPDGGNPANDADGEGDEDHERYGYLDFPEISRCIGNTYCNHNSLQQLLECTSFVCLKDFLFSGLALINYHNAQGILKEC